MLEIIIMFIFYIYALKALKDSGSVRILIKIACAKKTARKTIVYDRIVIKLQARKYGQVTHILRCNNRHYRSSRRSRMYWVRKLILRDAQFTLGCDGSRISRDSTNEKKDKNVKNRWKAMRGAKLVNYILFVILVAFAVWFYMHYVYVCMWIDSSKNL